MTTAPPARGRQPPPVGRGLKAACRICLRRRTRPKQREAEALEGASPLVRAIYRQFPPPRPNPKVKASAEALAAGEKACAGKTPIEVCEEFLPVSDLSGFGQLAASVYERSLPQTKPALCGCGGEEGGEGETGSAERSGLGATAKGSPARRSGSGTASPGASGGKSGNSAPRPGGRQRPDFRRRSSGRPGERRGHGDARVPAFPRRCRLPWDLRRP